MSTQESVQQPMYSIEEPSDQDECNAAQHTYEQQQQVTSTSSAGAAQAHSPLLLLEYQAASASGAAAHATPSRPLHSASASANVSTTGESVSAVSSSLLSVTTSTSAPFSAITTIVAGDTSVWDTVFPHLVAQIGKENAEQLKVTCEAEDIAQNTRYVGFRVRTVEHRASGEREYLGVMLRLEPYTAYIGGSSVSWYKGGLQRGTLTGVMYRPHGAKYMASVIHERENKLGELVEIDINHVSASNSAAPLKTLATLGEMLYRVMRHAPPAAAGKEGRTHRLLRPPSPTPRKKPTTAEPKTAPSARRGRGGRGGRGGGSARGRGARGGKRGSTQERTEDVRGGKVPVTPTSLTPAEPKQPATELAQHYDTAIATLAAEVRELRDVLRTLPVNPVRQQTADSTIVPADGAAPKSAIQVVCPAMDDLPPRVEVILHNQEEEQLRRAQKHLNHEINKYITFVSQHTQHHQ